jgi:hypothetical protein
MQSLRTGVPSKQKALSPQNLFSGDWPVIFSKSQINTVGLKSYEARHCFFSN